MIKKYEITKIITDALMDLNGMVSEPTYDGKLNIFEVAVKEDENHNLLFSFKEDSLSNNTPDEYKITIEYISKEKYM